MFIISFELDHMLDVFILDATADPLTSTRRPLGVLGPLVQSSVAQRIPVHEPFYPTIMPHVFISMRRPVTHNNILYAAYRLFHILVGDPHPSSYIAHRCACPDNHQRYRAHYKHIATVTVRWTWRVVGRVNVSCIAGEIQTRVPHEAAAFPTRSFRQVEREPPRPVRVGAVHHAVGMEERVLDAHPKDERERHDGQLAEEGRAGDVRVQVGQDHVGQVRQPLGSGRAVPLDAAAWMGCGGEKRRKNHAEGWRGASAHWAGGEGDVVDRRLLLERSPGKMCSFRAVQTTSHRRHRDIVLHHLRNEPRRRPSVVHNINK